jgi:hypothetical protein
MLYLPCQAPNEDRRAQKAFGLPQGKKDQPIDLAFAQQWGSVIQEWADRYGDRVSGWWFDGGYDWVKFNESIAQTYAADVRHGNPRAIVTFNPGVSLVRHTQAEDYTAGELNDPFEMIPASSTVDGSQWHALTFLGKTWAQRDTRFPAERWAEWARTVTERAARSRSTWGRTGTRRPAPSARSRRPRWRKWRQSQAVRALSGRRT